MTQQTNQREIKFRAWDKQEREMVFNGIEYQLRVIEITPDDEKINEDVGIGFSEYDYQRFELMQFTGLQDKNKKDVYEGDKTSDGVIEFNTETCCYIIRRVNGTFIRLEVRKKDLEIIGNIHENPELLNQ